MDKPGLRVGGSVALNLLQSILLLGVPLVFRAAFSLGLAVDNYEIFALACVGVVVLYLLQAGITLWSRYYVLSFTTELTLRLREHLVRKVCRISRMHYANSDHGVLHARLVQDTTRIEQMMIAILTGLIPSFLVTITMLSGMAWIQWALFLAVVVSFPIAYTINYAILSRLRPAIRSYHLSFEQFSKGMNHLVSLVDYVQAHSLEEFELERNRPALEKARISKRDAGLRMSAVILANQTTFGVLSVLVLAFGAFLIYRGAATLGDLLSFFAATALLRGKTSQLSQALPQTAEGLASIRTLSRFFDADEAQVHPGTKTLPELDTISLTNIGFGYHNDSPLLREVSLSVHKHSTTLLLGPNGSGKSTIAYLILGFYSPASGSLRVGQTPYEEIDLGWLRRHVSYVPQNPVILPGTVRDNLTYGMERVSTDQLDRAVRLGMAADFIVTAKDGMDTVIGERGIKLSGGQRQRLVISRALIRDPQLLILDEPFTHLDSDAILELLSNIEALEPRPAVLLITHEQMSTDYADHVYLLDSGAVLPVSRPRGRRSVV